MIAHSLYCTCLLVCVFCLQITRHTHPLALDRYTVHRYFTPYRCSRDRQSFSDHCSQLGASSRSDSGNKPICNVTYTHVPFVALSMCMLMLCNCSFHAAPFHCLGSVSCRNNCSPTSSLCLAVSHVVCCVVVCYCSLHVPFIQAVAWCIDELKRTVAIWKREYYTDGSVWKQNAEWNTKELVAPQQSQPCNTSTTSTQSHSHNEAHYCSTSLPQPLASHSSGAKHDCTCTRGVLIPAPDSATTCTSDCCSYPYSQPPTSKCPVTNLYNTLAQPSFFVPLIALIGAGAFAFSLLRRSRS